MKIVMRFQHLRTSSRHIVPATLAALLALGSLCALASGERASAAGALSARAAVEFAIRIPLVLQMRLRAHPAAITVTAADVARGEVVIQGAEVDITANDRRGYLLNAQLLDPAFDAVEISGLARSVRASGTSAVVPMPSTAGMAAWRNAKVAYRLSLAAGAAPGRYAWPVALSVQEP